MSESCRGGVAAEVRRRFGEAPGTILRLNQNEIAERVGVHRVSVARAIKSMVDAGDLERVGQGRYRLGQGSAVEPPPAPEVAASPPPSAESAQSEIRRLCELVERLLKRQDEIERENARLRADFLVRMERMEANYVELSQQLRKILELFASSGATASKKKKPIKKTKAAAAPEDFTLEVQVPNATQTIPPTPFEAIIGLWHECASNLEPYTELTARGRGTMRRLWESLFELDDVLALIEDGTPARDAALQFIREHLARANESPILQGLTGRKRITLEKLLAKTAWETLVEGGYQPETAHITAVQANQRDIENLEFLVAQKGFVEVAKVAQELYDKNKRMPYPSTLLQHFGYDGNGAAAGVTPFGRRRETHLERFDRVRGVPDDFEAEVAKFRARGKEIPAVYLAIMQGREAARAKDAASRGCTIDASVASAESRAVPHAHPATQELSRHAI